MPTYSYRRPDGSVFDVFQRITDDALTEDPETGQPVVRVISGGAGLQFKGSGFYLTDYVRKDSKSEASDRTSQKTGTAEPAAKAEAKAETKAATPAATKAATKAPAPAAKKD